MDSIMDVTEGLKELLLGVDAGTPPCECIMPDASLCGRPSETRIMSRCAGCGDTVTGFACGTCWQWISLALAMQVFECIACGAERTVVES